MKRLLLLAIATSLLPGSVAMLYAQKLDAHAGEIRVGLSVGLTANAHIEGLGYALLWDECDCRYYRRSADSEWGYAIGMVGEYNVDNDLRFNSHVLYARHPGSASFGRGWQITAPDPDHHGSTQTIADIDRPKATVNYDLVEIDLMAGFKANKSRPVGMALGLAVGYTFGLKRDVVAEIKSSDESMLEAARFRTRDDGQLLVVDEDESLDKTSPFRLSLRAGFFYDFPISDLLTITPGVYYDHALTPVVADSKWKMHALMLHVDVSRGLYR